MGTGDKRRGHVTPREQGETAPHPCTHDTGLSNGTKKNPKQTKPNHHRKRARKAKKGATGSRPEFKSDRADTHRGQGGRGR